MEEPSKIAEEQTAAETRGAVSLATGQTTTHGAGKGKRRSKKCKSTDADAAQDRATRTEGGIAASPLAKSKSKRGSKAKSEATSTSTRPESQTEPSEQSPVRATTEPPAPVIVVVTAQRPTEELINHPQVQPSPSDRNPDSDIATAQYRGPKPATVPIIASVLIIFVMVTIVFSLIVSRMKLAKHSDTSSVSGMGVTTSDGIASGKAETNAGREASALAAGGDVDGKTLATSDGTASAANVTRKTDHDKHLITN